MIRFLRAVATVLAARLVLFSPSAVPASASLQLHDGIIGQTERTFSDIRSMSDTIKQYPTGTIGAYITDLDNDGEQELVDVFLCQGYHEGYGISGDTLQIRVGLYRMNDSGTTIRNQEFVLCEIPSGFLMFDFTLQSYSAGDKEYLISDLTLGLGAGNIKTAIVLALDDNKQFYAETILDDPGATSAVFLGQINSVSVSELVNLREMPLEALYSWEYGPNGFDPDAQQYSKMANNALAPYGAEVIPPADTIPENAWAYLPFQLKNGKAVVASVSGNYDKQGATLKVEYSGNDPFPETLMNDPEDFHPEEFYRSILQEQRPEYADCYRFLDLDKDGREELLVGDYTINYGINNPVLFALYSCDKDMKQPTQIYLQFPGFPRYSLYSDGIVEEKPSPNWHADPCGYIWYQLSCGQLHGIFGLLYSSECNRHEARTYMTSNEDVLSAPIDQELSQWELVSNSMIIDREAVIEKSDNITLQSAQEIYPFFMDLMEYDNKKKYQRIYLGEPLSGFYGYDTLLNDYCEMVNQLDTLPYGMNNDLGTVTGCFTDYWKDMPAKEYGFVLKDLNNDGTPELAAGGITEDGRFILGDLYTIYGGRIVCLARSYYRDQFSLGPQNEIIEGGTSGAVSMTRTAFIIKKGMLEPIRAIELENDQFYMLNHAGTSAESWGNISEDVFHKADTEEYRRQDSQPFIPFSKWQTGWALIGDVNADGTVTVADAVLLTRFIGEDPLLTEEQNDKILHAEFDIDKDGLMTVRDLMALLASVSLDKLHLLSAVMRCCPEEECLILGNHQANIYAFWRKTKMNIRLYI